MTDNQRKNDAGLALALIREARTGTLCVVDTTGHPYGALVNVGHDLDGAPVLLISELARHTKALRVNPKASLAIAGPLPAEGDPLTGFRLTLAGEMHEVERAQFVSAYIAEHPYAAGYAEFSDFSFWSLKVSQVYAIGGFGRIYSFAPEEIFTAEPA
jgi:heme iron utilization protein